MENADRIRQPVQKMESTMNPFQKGDRVRLIGNAAYGPPDRRGKIGSVQRRFIDEGLGTLGQRLDVIFDGEEKPILGRVEWEYEKVT